MVKTAISAIVALSLILVASVAEILYVNATFEKFRLLLEDLYKKVQSENATFDDGYAVREFWLKKKDVLHVVFPHAVINPIENELNEAMGYLRQGNTEDALPKVEILINLTYSLPESYSISLKNVF